MASGCSLLREDERLGGTPVIFLTAKGMTADRIAGFRAGVDDYNLKPLTPTNWWCGYATWRSARSACSKRPATPIPTWPMAKQIGELRTILQGGGRPRAWSIPTPREASVCSWWPKANEQEMPVSWRHRSATSRKVERRAKIGTASRTELVRYALEHGFGAPRCKAGARLRSTKAGPTAIGSSRSRPLPWAAGQRWQHSDRALGRSGRRVNAN